MIKRAQRIIAVALAVGLLVAGCGGKRHDGSTGASASTGTSCETSGERITIATGPTGGVYYPIGSEIAQLISENTNLKANAGETAGASGQNIQQLMAGHYDLAIAQADVAADAANGKGIFDGKPQRFQALTRLHGEYLHVIVRADSGLNSIADLRGKRVSTGVPRSGTELTIKRLLQAAGLNPEKDIEAQRLDLTKSSDAFTNGTIDAFVWVGGIPTTQIKDIMTSLRDKAKFIDVTPQLEELKKINPAYGQAVIPAEIYKQPADLPTIGVASILLVREDFPFGNACMITKLIFNNKAALEKAHAAAKDITLGKARQIDPVTLHPGARQALDALGG
jgi:TRAP transporter TAXI family solute receptor